MNFFSLLSVLFAFIFLILLPFLLILVLFLSPHAPSRPLSKNALSFFIRDVISEVYTSSGTPLPSVSRSSFSSTSSIPSGSSSCSASALWAHGVRGVAASLAVRRNAPLSSVLEAATRSSAFVFTSFYLTDVQFSSSRGFRLGPVVAAGSVVVGHGVYVTVV